MERNEYDALIIGGRAAGGALALLLARQGRRVLVVDRDPFPSDTMSTHYMSPAAVALLRRLGVLEDLLTAGFRRVTRHRTWVEDCCFEAPAGPGGAFSLAPRRNVLDPLLIEHAVAAGAEFHDRTRADGLVIEGGRVGGAFLTKIGGSRHEVRASVVIGADGKTSSVAQWVDAEKYRTVPGLRPAYYAYWHGLEPRSEPTFEMWFGGGHIGFLFPMREGEDCIALELQPEEFETFRSDAKRRYVEQVRCLPGMDARMGNAELEDRVIGVRSVENYFRQPWGPGWALTGDAAYLKDPSTGSGVGDALQQSLLLAAALEKWFAGTPWEEALNEYHRQRDAAMLPYYEQTLAFTQMADLDAAEFSVLAAVLSNPAMARTLAAAVPGLQTEIFDENAQRWIGRVAGIFESARAAEAGPLRVPA